MVETNSEYVAADKYSCEYQEPQQGLSLLLLSFPGGCLCHTFIKLLIELILYCCIPGPAVDGYPGQCDE